MNSIKLTKYAESFFLYEYFGIIKDPILDAKGELLVKEDDDESAAIKCAYRAYLDMCRTLEYIDDIEQKSDPSQQEKRSFFVQCICSRLASIFCSDLTFEQKKSAAYSIFFIDEHPRDCFSNRLKGREIKKDSGKRENESINYGQAQKWINMTLKYMGIIGIISDTSDLDVPIDSYILKASSRDFGLKFPVDKEEYNKAFNETDISTTEWLWKKYSSDNTMVWSKLKRVEYKKIIENIETMIFKNKSPKYNFPLDWENEAWIAESVFEASKDKTKKWLYSHNLTNTKKG